jgi:hypothetical protein
MQKGRAKSLNSRNGKKLERVVGCDRAGQRVMSVQSNGRKNRGSPCNGFPKPWVGGSNPSRPTTERGTKAAKQGNPTTSDGESGEAWRAQVSICGGSVFGTRTRPRIRRSSSSPSPTRFWWEGDFQADQEIQGGRAGRIPWLSVFRNFGCLACPWKLRVPTWGRRERVCQFPPRRADARTR